MSAYLVEDSVVDFILSGWLRLEKGGYPHAWVKDPSVSGEFNKVGGEPDSFDKIGQMMIDENYASLAARYGDPSDSHKYEFRRHKVAFSMELVPMIAQLGKAIACLNYQSCEHKGWHESVAYQILEAIKDRALGGLADEFGSDWGAPEHIRNDEPVRKLIRLV